MPGSLANSSVSFPTDCVTWVIKTYHPCQALQVSLRRLIARLLRRRRIEQVDQFGIKQFRRAPNQRMAKHLLLPLAPVDGPIRRPLRHGGGPGLIGQHCELQPNTAACRTRESLLQLLPLVSPIAVLHCLIIRFSKGNYQSVWPESCYSL